MYNRQWLRDQIKFFTHDSTISDADADRFIDMGLAQISTKLETPENLAYMATQIDTNPYPLPAAINTLRSITAPMGGGYVLEAVPVKAIDRYRGNGYPVAYAVRGSSVMFGPFQAGEYTLEYFERVELGSQPDDTHPALEKYPILCESAALSQAYRWKEDAEMYGTYEARTLQRQFVNVGKVKFIGCHLMRTAMTTRCFR